MKNLNEPEESSRRRRLVDAFKECATSSTAHGVPNIVRNDLTVLKIIWSICLVISSAYCAYSVYNSIVGYYQYNVLTSIDTVYENPMEFPAVTICNANAFVTYEAINYVNTTLAKNNIDNPAYSPFLSALLNYSRIQEAVSVYLSQIITLSNAKNLNDTEKQKLGHAKERMIVGCLYANTPCDLNSFRWYYHSQYGNCFQFNTGYDYYGNPASVVSTVKTGSNFGLRMLLFVGSPNNVNTLSYSTGAHVFIHNKTSSPVVSDGLDLPTGLLSNLLISKSTTDQLPKPYNDCYDDLTSPDKFDSFFYKKTFESNYTYRQLDCLNLCTQDFYIKECGCADSALPTLYGKKFCSSLTEAFCLYQSYSKLFYQSNLMNSFYKYCPKECSIQTFTATTSFSACPSDMFGDLLTNNSLVIANLNYIGKPVTPENVKKYFFWVNIYYDQTMYTSITQTPSQQFVDMMSSIGGTCGLYIGVSFLSLVEFVEIFVQAFDILFAKKRRQIGTPINKSVGLVHPARSAIVNRQINLDKMPDYF